MELTFAVFDGRTRRTLPVINRVTGEIVGTISSGGVGFGNFGGINVSLFDSKYCITVNRYEECWGFVKGVEAVLNRMTSTGNEARKATVA